MPPGLEKMMEFTKMQRLNARLPPEEDVFDAVNTFLQHKAKLTAPIPDVQAKHLLRSILYIKPRLIESLDLPTLRLWSRAFNHNAHHNSATHQELVVLLWRDVRGNMSDPVAPYDIDDIKPYLTALCYTGATVTARDTFLEHAQKYKPVQEYEHGFSRANKMWDLIFKAFAKEGNETELLRTIEILQENCLTFSSTSSSFNLVRLYTTKNNVEKAFEWYGKCKTYSGAAHASGLVQAAQIDLLQLCFHTSHFELGQSIIRDMTTGTPTQRQWNAILRWAAQTGKGADEIDRMMGVMERANHSLPEAEWRIPDVKTINSLVEVAVERKDPYLAERFVALGRARNIEPDALTLTYQMQYRLAVGDTDGALTVYKHLQSHDLSQNEDVAVVNGLIRAMCASGRQDFESIMNVAADLSDRQAAFDPTTVSALAVLHLSRDEVHDVIDLLNTHVYGFDIAGRTIVRDTLVEYCLKPSTTTAQAWDAYTIFRQVFDDTPREQRVQVMNEFFRRQRPDMAVHVFNHMRSHTRDDTIPTIDTYVTCLAGIGRSKDEESLEVVHNQLKLDFNIEPNTHLNNALMHVYTACGSPRAALGFWNEIASSREGPNINSIHLALRACEDAPWGDEKAQQIWTKLSRAGIELDQALWASYAGALVGNGNVELAINTLEEAHVKQGLDMDTFV